MVKRWKQAVGMTAAWPGTWKDTKSVQKNVAITIVCAVNPVDYREGIFEEREMKEATDAVVRQGFMYELSINDDTALPHLYKHPSRQCWTLLGLQDKERAGAIWKYPWSTGRMGVEPPTAEVILDFWKFQEWGKYILGPKQNCAPTDGAPHNRVFITQSLLRHPEPLYVDIPMLHPDAPDPDVKWIQGWACEAKLAKDGFFEGIPVHPMFTVKYGEALTADFITKSPLNPNQEDNAYSIPASIAYRFIKPPEKEPAKAKPTAAERRRKSLGAKASGDCAKAPAPEDLAQLILAPVGGGPPPKAGVAEAILNVGKAPPKAPAKPKGPEQAKPNGPVPKPEANPKGPPLGKAEVPVPKQEAPPAKGGVM
jgi:hypothetical protein